MSLDDAMDYAVKKVAVSKQRTQKMKQNMEDEKKKSTNAGDSSSS